MNKLSSSGGKAKAAFYADITKHLLKRECGIATVNKLHWAELTKSLVSHREEISFVQKERVPAGRCGRCRPWRQ